jgi:hypothetical protein
LHDIIELGGDTLPNDLRKFAEYKLATTRREWPKFEDVHDLLKEGIQLHEKQHPIKEEKDQRKRLVETDDLKEDDNELNYMVITSVAKKFSVDPHADLLNSDKSYISNILQNRPNIEDNHEELNEKREKVQTMNINCTADLKNMLMKRRMTCKFIYVTNKSWRSILQRPPLAGSASNYSPKISKLRYKM